jgi:hypothetical protein
LETFRLRLDFIIFYIDFVLNTLYI